MANHLPALLAGLYSRSVKEAFELLDPANAQSFLKSFGQAARRKGEALFRIGGVRELLIEQPGLTYSAQVKDAEMHAVHLEYDQVDGWSGDCSCPQETRARFASRSNRSRPRATPFPRSPNG